jgi:hypothetical protein
MYDFWDIQDDEELIAFDEEEFVWYVVLCFCVVMAIAGLTGILFAVTKSKMGCMLFAVFATLVCLASLAIGAAMAWQHSEIKYELGTIEECMDNYEDMDSAATKAQLWLCTSACPCSVTTATAIG